MKALPLKDYPQITQMTQIYAECVRQASPVCATMRRDTPSPYIDFPGLISVHP